MTILCPTCSRPLTRNSWAAYCEDMHGVAYTFKTRGEMKAFDIAIEKYLGTFKPSTGRPATIKIEIDGVERTVSQLADDPASGTDKTSTIYHRIERGWPVLSAVKEKPLGHGEYYRGEVEK